MKDKINSDNARLIKVDAIFEEEKAIYKSEMKQLKTDYSDLLDKYERIQEKLGKLKGRYSEALLSKEELEEQLKSINAIATLLGTAIGKVKGYLNITKKGEDTK